MATEAMKAGTTASVQYALQFPSGQTMTFTEWSEFQIAEHFSLNERNLGKSLKREHRIEEVQSQQGTSPTAKVGAFCQAGIYAIGQLKKMPPSQERITTVVLLKDLGVQVALATLNPQNKEGDTLGEVTYKLVDSVQPYILNTPMAKWMQQIAALFIAVLQATLGRQ